MFVLTKSKVRIILIRFIICEGLVELDELKMNWSDTLRHLKFEEKLFT